MSKREEIFNNKGGINWDYFCSLVRKEGAVGVKKQDRIMCEILIPQGILSHKKENNWVVMSGNLISTPIVGVFLFFTKKEDAIAYARASIGNTHEPEIYRFSTT